MNLVKKAVLDFFWRAGYEIRKRSNPDGVQTEEDLEIYRSLYSVESIQNKLFYNIGSGGFSHPFWTNLDYVSEWYQSIQKDIVHIDLMKMESLPIESASAEIIYTSHTIEHIKDKAVENLFKESYRALKMGGIFRVTTGPDADLDFDAMLRGDKDWFYWDKWYDKEGSYEKDYYGPASKVPLEERWLHHVATQLAPNDRSPSSVKVDSAQIKTMVEEWPKEKILDYLTSLCEFQPARPGNHVSWWNADKIIDLMKASGFTKVYKSGYSQSQAAVLRNVNFFDNTHPQVSVYVEAVK